MDIMLFLDIFIHVYGCNMCILESSLNFWSPNILTFSKFRHPVSKYWLRPCYGCLFVHPLPLKEPFRSPICLSVGYQKIFITRQKVIPLYRCWYCINVDKKASQHIDAGADQVMIMRYPCIWMLVLVRCCCRGTLS